MGDEYILQEAIRNHLKTIAIRSLKIGLDDLCTLIGATPSGELRNALTEVNIIMMIELDKLIKVQVK